MKKFQHKLSTLFFIVIFFPNFGFSQDSLAFDLSCEVNRIIDYIPMKEDQLAKAKTLADLNKRYESSWVKEYISVEISVSHKGKIKKAVSQNDILSLEQKKIMNMADWGSDISARILYLPDNTLKHNDIKEINFTFSVDPKNEAEYYGGEQQLDQYLKDNAIDKIPKNNFRQYNLTAVKFTITEKGEIVDTHILESSGNNKTDQLLLETICNMPDWKPAEYSDGTKTKQEFVLAMGDMNSCVVNLLNIREY